MARHRVDMEFVKEQAEDGLEHQQTCLGYAHSRPRPTSLHRAYEVCLNNAEYWSFFDETGSSERLNRSLLLAAHAGTAVFRSVSIKDETIQVWLDGPLEVGAFVPADFTDVGTWLNTFYTAIMCRESKLIDQLAAMPMDIFSPGSDQCFYTWIQTLQAFWRNDPNLSAYFDATHEDIAKREFSPKRTIDNLLRPQVLLCQTLLTGDPESFNRELENILQQHRKFWSTPANKHDPEGFLCLPAIAFAALAHGIGMPITVTSGYLLQHQINRPFSKAIPVLQQHSAKQGPANNE